MEDGKGSSNRNAIGFGIQKVSQQGGEGAYGGTVQVPRSGGVAVGGGAYNFDALNLD